MSANITLKLFILGLSATELKLLSRVVELSERRSCQLILLPDEQANMADVIIANYSYPRAQQWVSYSTRLVLSKPVIWIDAKNAPPMHHPIQRPIQWSQLLLIIKKAILKRRKFPDADVNISMLEGMTPLHQEVHDVRKIEESADRENISQPPTSMSASTKALNNNNMTNQYTDSVHTTGNLEPQKQGNTTNPYNNNINDGSNSPHRVDMRSNNTSNNTPNSAQNSVRMNETQNLSQYDNRNNNAQGELNERNSADPKVNQMNEDTNENIHNKQKILVVDDSQAVRQHLKVVLEKHNHHVILAENGIEALNLFHPTNVDCILMDVLMPEMDGYEACRKIKRKAKSHGKIPIIMLTSKSSPFDKIKGKMAGCDSYLTKPVKLEKLNQAIIKFTKKYATY